MRFQRLRAMTESKRVLIVEDDEAIFEITQELLTHSGYSVDFARNGQEALQHLRSGHPLPCLILLDLMMPVMDGFEFRKEQIQDSGISHIPVVIMTAEGQIEAKTRKIGAKAFIRKPFDIESFLRTID